MANSEKQPKGNKEQQASPEAEKQKEKVFSPEDALGLDGIIRQKVKAELENKTNVNKKDRADAFLKAKEEVDAAYAPFKDVLGDVFVAANASSEKHSLSDEKKLGDINGVDAWIPGASELVELARRKMVGEFVPDNDPNNPPNLDGYDPDQMPTAEQQDIFLDAMKAKAAATKAEALAKFEAEHFDGVDATAKQIRFANMNGRAATEKRQKYIDAIDQARASGDTVSENILTGELSLLDEYDGMRGTRPTAGVDEAKGYMSEILSGNNPDGTQTEVLMRYQTLQDKSYAKFDAGIRNDMVKIMDQDTKNYLAAEKQYEIDLEENIKLLRDEVAVNNARLRDRGYRKSKPTRSMVTANNRYHSLVRKSIAHKLEKMRLTDVEKEKLKRKGINAGGAQLPKTRTGVAELVAQMTLQYSHELETLTNAKDQENLKESKWNKRLNILTGRETSGKEIGYRAWDVKHIGTEVGWLAAAATATAIGGPFGLAGVLGARGALEYKQGNRRKRYHRKETIASPDKASLESYNISRFANIPGYGHGGEVRSTDLNYAFLDNLVRNGQIQDRKAKREDIEREQKKNRRATKGLALAAFAGGGGIIDTQFLNNSIFNFFAEPVKDVAHAFDSQFYKGH